MISLWKCKLIQNVNSRWWSSAVSEEVFTHHRASPVFTTGVWCGTGSTLDNRKKIRAISMCCLYKIFMISLKSLDMSYGSNLLQLMFFDFAVCFQWQVWDRHWCHEVVCWHHWKWMQEFLYQLFIIQYPYFTFKSAEIGTQQPTVVDEVVELNCLVLLCIPSRFPFPWNQQFLANTKRYS